MVHMSQAVAYQIEHRLRINYNKLGRRTHRQKIAPKEGGLKQLGRWVGERGGFWKMWLYGLVVRCSRVAPNQRQTH